MAEEAIKNEITEKLFETLEKEDSIESSYEWSNKHNVKHDVVEGVLRSLAYRQVVALEQKTTNYLKLSAEGKAALTQGTPEFRLWEMLGNEQLDLAECEKRLANKEVFEVGRRQCMKSKPQWLKVTKSGKTQILERSQADGIEEIIKKYEETVKSHLRAIDERGSEPNVLDKKTVDEYTRRKMVETGYVI